MDTPNNEVHIPTYYRVYMKGLHVGIGIRAERMEVDDTNVFFYIDHRMTASFWAADIDRVTDIDAKVLPLAA